jgi:hypothetical protein
MWLESSLLLTVCHCHPTSTQPPRRTPRSSISISARLCDRNSAEPDQRNGEKPQSHVCADAPVRDGLGAETEEPVDAETAATVVNGRPDPAPPPQHLYRRWDLRATSAEGHPTTVLTHRSGKNDVAIVYLRGVLRQRNGLAALADHLPPCQGNRRRSHRPPNALWRRTTRSAKRSTCSPTCGRRSRTIVGLGCEQKVSKRCTGTRTAVHLEFVGDF